MKSAFNVTIDTADVIALAGVAEKIDGTAINRILTRVVNEVAGKFDTRVRQAMNAGIALDDGYISSRMERSNTGGVPRVEITSAGPGRAGRFGLTILGHYSPQAITTSAPGAKGDPKRGIAPGQKAAGVSVEVTRGSRKPIPKAFTMTLREGTRAGDKTGVFVRENGKAVHKYGVSPYSLFRFQINKGVGVGLEDELRAAALEGLAQL